MSDTRLIERWLPIAALGIESVRERTPMTPFPAPNRLHVWWARRPLVASRAAVMASLLPETADRDKFMHVLGIHGDPVASKRRIAIADRNGQRLGKDAYGYPRAFSYVPSSSELEDLFDGSIGSIIVDPTAGGGSIPFEAGRLGMKAFANDLNPVAAAILRATIDFPMRYGLPLVELVRQIGGELTSRLKCELAWAYPPEPEPNCRPDGYLWARTIVCPYCTGLIPLSPNWRLTPGGIGVRLSPRCETGPGSEARLCDFEIVENQAKQSAGTVADGDAICPFSDCGRVIGDDEVKRQAKSGSMGDQLFAVVYKRRVETRLKSGKRGKDRWERRFRAPRWEDNNSATIADRLAEKLIEWELLDVVPTERYPEISNDDRPNQYGMPKWRDMFSPRQLLGHGTAVEIFRSMVEKDRVAGRLSDIRKAAYTYLALTIDRACDYNARLSYWDINTQAARHVFGRHDFAFVWSYAELALLVEGLGYDWALKQTAKCIEELVELAGRDEGVHRNLFSSREQRPISPAVITCKPGDALDHIEDASVDAVIIDPPYGANVMYAELSDFFYVWLKRTAGLVMPDLFTRYLTDKEAEAVASKAKFKGQKGANALASRDYQERMQSIFAECRRILKPTGIMTVMFTHKETGAWDALTKGLIESGFIITASWPVRSESEGGLHIKNKAAANSTIFLVCRPRLADDSGEVTYWEDLEPVVAKAVRARVEEFQNAGIEGVDLYLASFGPALEQFSRHWPLRRGTPRAEQAAKKRRKQAELFEEHFDPFAVTPEDALDAARREVKTWRLNQFTNMRGRADLDPITSWFVLAWDAFKAPVFAYDEGLRLARAVGVDLDQLMGRICEKKGSDIRLWDSKTRAEKGSLGGADGARSMLDALHHAAHRARTRTLEAARDMLEDAGLSTDPTFLTAMEAVLEVLPPSRTFTQVELTGDLKSASDDFDALEKLRRLAYADRVDEPRQLGFWAEEAA